MKKLVVILTLFFAFFSAINAQIEEKKQKEGIEPYDADVVIFHGKQYGIYYSYPNDIFSFEKSTGKWRQFMTLDFKIDEIMLYDGTLIISKIDEESQNHYQVDVKSKSIEDYVIQDSLLSQYKNRITKLVFEYAHGCISTQVYISGYEFVESKFVESEIERKQWENKISKMPLEIDKDSINKILEFVDKLRNNKTTIASDIHFTSDDIRVFREFIDSLKFARDETNFDFDIPMEDYYYRFYDETDFDFCKDVACSIDDIPDSIINYSIIRSIRGNSSTDAPVWTLTLYTDDEKQIILRNFDENSFLKVCWIVEYEGLSFRVTSLELSRVINTLSNDRFMGNLSEAENLALSYIATHLDYKRSETGKEYDFVKKCEENTNQNSAKIILSGSLLIFIILLIVIYIRRKNKK